MFQLMFIGNYLYIFLNILHKYIKVKRITEADGLINPLNRYFNLEMRTSLRKLDGKNATKAENTLSKAFVCVLF